jgi:hypothetical protein
VTVSGRGKAVFDRIKAVLDRFWPYLSVLRPFWTEFDRFKAVLNRIWPF